MVQLNLLKMMIAVTMVLLTTSFPGSRGNALERSSSSRAAWLVLKKLQNSVPMTELDKDDNNNLQEQTSVFKRGTPTEENDEILNHKLEIMELTVVQLTSLLQEILENRRAQDPSLYSTDSIQFEQSTNEEKRKPDVWSRMPRFYGKRSTSLSKNDFLTTSDDTYLSHTGDEFIDFGRQPSAMKTIQNSGDARTNTGDLAAAVMKGYLTDHVPRSRYWSKLISSMDTIEANNRDDTRFKRANAINRMPVFFGKRSKLLARLFASGAEKSATIVNKREVNDLDGLLMSNLGGNNPDVKSDISQANATQSGAVVLDRMPQFYG